MENAYRAPFSIFHFRPVTSEMIMAFANFTGEANQNEAYEKLQCSSGLTERMNVHLIYILAFNILLSFTALLGNALILIALHKESSLHSPSKLLLRCLASTDISIGLIAEPLGIIRWISMVKKDWNLCRYSLPVYFIAGYTLSSVSLLTLTAISVDRLLALLMGLRYKQVVSLKRTYVIVITLWVLPALLTAMWFWNPSINFLYRAIGIPLSLIISIFSYTKIFFTLRHQQNQVQDHVQQPNQTNQLNIARYKKAVSTAIWLQLTLVACYLPYSVEAASRPSSTLPSAKIYTVTLVYKWPTTSRRKPTISF